MLAGQYRTWHSARVGGYPGVPCQYRTLHSESSRAFTIPDTARSDAKMLPALHTSVPDTTESMLRMTGVCYQAQFRASGTEHLRAKHENQCHWQTSRGEYGML
eukprot:1508699-Rhodomonas_salina.2